MMVCFTKDLMVYFIVPKIEDNFAVKSSFELISILSHKRRFFYDDGFWFNDEKENKQAVISER